MTSDEILAQLESLRTEAQRALAQGNTMLTRQYLSEVPLWEIAYQLAVLNERNASGDRQAVDAMLKKLGLGSQVGAGSETEVRGEWRVGRQVPLNVYERNRPVCQCHFEADARRIVATMNERTTPLNPETEVRRGRLDIEEVLLGMATESTTGVYQAHEDVAVRASILGDYLLEWNSLGPNLRYEVQMFIETHRRTTPPDPQTTAIQPQKG